MLTKDQLLQLQKKANEARQVLLPMLATAGSGHSGGPLGLADIMTSFYFHILRHDPKNPDWEERDRLILSCGHYCPIRYVLMALSGYFPVEELTTLRKINSRLQGHPHRTALPGVETTSGPLGEGLSQALGIALAGKLDKKDFHVYCITSDGEHQEGNTWEAVMFGGNSRLDNLTVIVDYNNMQIDGPVKDIMGEDPIEEKYKAFNWHVLSVDGNNIEEFITTIEKAKTLKGKPTVIIARTVPGKGVSYMEHNYVWHGIPPDLQEVKGAPAKGQQLAVALEELQAIQEKVEKGEVV